MSERRRQEFEQSAMVHLPELLRMAIRLCGQRAAAEDLVQETFLQAWRAFDRFQPGTNCRAWLYKILFGCRSHDRRGRARQPAVVDLDAIGEEYLRFDAVVPDVLTVDSVRAAFERVPEPFRTTIMLVDIEQLSYREASAILAVPIGTVMSRLSRGRRLLRHQLAAAVGPPAVADHDRKARSRS